MIISFSMGVFSRKSSTDEAVSFPPETESFLNDFKGRHSFDSVMDFINALKNQKVLVIGDTIIDEYHYCKPLGMSAKENLISVNYESEESFAGGAVATVSHVAGFVKEVGLFSLLGKDNSREDFIRERLGNNVRPHFVYRDDGPTVTIRRYIEKIFLKKYFQLYFHNPFIPEALDKHIAQKLEPLLDEYKTVLVNDFGLGFLGTHAINVICRKARFLAVNTQTNSSNRGFNFITKYPRMDYGCIDHVEIRLATQNRHASISDLVQEISRAVAARYFSVTMGHLGAITYDAEKKEVFEIPVFSQKVIDRVGAGDAFFSITAPLVAMGVPMDAVGFIRNTIGAIAVTIVGNERSIGRNELSRWMSTLLK